MKKTLQFLAAAAVLTGMAISCADLDDIRNRMDELDGRITALETITTNLNGNIEAMQALYQGSTINSVTESDGVWTIVLSNGDELTLTQGSIGVGNPPVMSVDKDGYWMVDYGDGPEYLYSDAQKTQKIKAVGDNGVTPVFGVDSEGYWIVSYDAGKTFAQVKDPDGNPVKAVSEGAASGEFFKDVNYENNIFTVTLDNGEVLTIPVVASFKFSLKACQSVEYFESGQTKTYVVESEGVVNDF